MGSFIADLNAIEARVWPETNAIEEFVKYYADELSGFHVPIQAQLLSNKHI